MSLTPSVDRTGEGERENSPFLVNSNANANNADNGDERFSFLTRNEFAGQFRF